MTEDDFKKLLEEVCKKENIEPSKVEEFYRERHKESWNQNRDCGVIMVSKFSH